MIGPNGAGKSTLLAALAGLVPAEGEVAVDGESWTDPPLSVQDRRVGLVFQAGLLFPHLSALDNVAFGPTVARGRPNGGGCAGSVLARALRHRGPRRTPSAASSPAVRRSASRSPGPWPVEPVLLLLDEPFSGLDAGVATSLRLELARHLAAYDGVCLLVTHDAIDALTLADRVLVLDDGRIVQSGSPRDVAARPRTEHVARLVGLNVLRDEDDFLAFGPEVVTVSRASRRGRPAIAGVARSPRSPSTAPRCGCW